MCLRTLGVISLLKLFLFTSCLQAGEKSTPPPSITLERIIVGPSQDKEGKIERKKKSDNGEKETETGPLKVEEEVEPRSVIEEKEIDAAPLITKKLAELYLREVLSGLLPVVIETQEDNDQYILKLLYAVMPDLNLFTYRTDGQKDTMSDILTNYLDNKDHVKISMPSEYGETRVLYVLRKNKIESKIKIPFQVLDCLFSPINMGIKFRGCPR